MNKVELLAPAGNYDAFLGALQAGADAVYLGGTRYGARAFADNFDEETLCRAIFYAHLFDRRVYLTLNTLMKPQEMEEIVSFLMPYYLAGLDGVIVQDIGLFMLLKREFPLLELHISTQMTVTGAYSAAWLKELGAVRVVPARELSLEEIRNIKEQGIEVETFIHGAMCYCYSGQCFFSSFLGGRSGNRGKCAQPCRLPYRVKLSDSTKPSGEEYPLSLKDMCTVELLPELIEAGIDSFKIEGRMKQAAYAAGVTAVYRKYIDRLLTHPGEEFSLAPKDRELLQTLYLRMDIQTGYYHRQNGREMVTLHQPGYNPQKEELIAALEEKYCKTPMKAGVTGSLVLKKNSPARLTLQFKGQTVCAEGAVIEEARNHPLTEEDVEKQMRKTGNTDFTFTLLEIQMDQDIFLPVKQLNELRRAAFTLLEKEIKEQTAGIRQESLQTGQTVAAPACRMVHDRDSTQKGFTLSVSDRAQCLLACRLEKVSRIYAASDLFISADEELFDALRGASGSREIWITLPAVVRQKDISGIDRLLESCPDFVTGLLVSNLESYSYLVARGYGGHLALNHHIYVWNRETVRFWENRVDSFCAPVECSIHEWKTLQHPKAEYLCYGRIPMMVTANCIRKTEGRCKKTKGSPNRACTWEQLMDRYNTVFPVLINCNSCYNVIYNSVPLSLHGQMDTLNTLTGKAYRLDFTTETPGEMESVVRAFSETLDFSVIGEYTTGHYKKGAL